MKNFTTSCYRTIVAACFVLGCFLLGGTADAQILNNSKIRIGNGSEASINSTGNLRQPHYWNASAGSWRKLTYSTRSLDHSFGVGGDGSNEWNINGSVLHNPVLSSQVINTSNFTYTTSPNGYGTLISTGTITINGQLMEVTNTYVLPQNSAYIKATVRLKNVSTSTMQNVRMWVGTGDDWVGLTDIPTKQKGNLVGGSFTPITAASTRAAAVQITSGSEGVLFYTNSNRGNTGIHSCCSFTNIVNQNPTSSAIQLTNDGSYGFFVRMNDLAIGASDEFTWYYAAGELANLDDIINEVAAVSGAMQNITHTSADFNATASVNSTGYWMVVPQNSTSPTAAQIELGVNYGSVTVTQDGSGAMTANVQRTFNITGLTAATNYDLYFVSKNASNVYSSVLRVPFSTLAYQLPVVSTSAVTTASCTSLQSGGNVTSDGGSPVTARGIVWGTSPSPTIAGSSTNNGTGTGSFTSTATGLTIGQTYYVRAYATNAAGTAYGNELVYEGDNTPPVITCSARTMASCETALPNFASTAVVTDNCSGAGSITVTQTPAAGTPVSQGGSVTVTLTATDQAGNQSTCTFVVTRPNETPVAVNDNASVCQGSSVTIDVLANDSHPQGKVLTVNDNTLPSQGTLTKNANNTFTYTAPAGYSGPVTFTYNIKASDATLANNENGHYYEWVPAPSITWNNARTQAATKTYNGLQGYLVTITSASEMSFVSSKLQGQGWMGASDLAYEGVWRWVTGPEGLENGGLGRHFSNQSKIDWGNCYAYQSFGVNGNYANWGGGEPNDCGANVNQYTPTDPNRGGEHWAHFFGAGLWNDFPNDVGGNIQGYVVEYGGLEGCIPVLTATATVTIEVKAKPVVTVTPASTNICPGTTTTLNASGADTYQWSNGAVTPSITVGAGTFTVTGTTNGCVSVPVAATITSTDNIPPVANMATLPTITGACSATVTAIPTATDNCSGLINGVTAGPTTFNSQGTYTITWTYTDANGNASTQTQTVIVDDVTPPVINLNANGALTGLGAVATYNTSVGGSGTGGLSHAHGIAYDLQRNTVWVTDSDLGNKVYEFAATQPSGSTLGVLSSFSPAMPSTIEGIAFDPTDNTLWIVDFQANVKHVTRTGAVLPGGFSASATIPVGTFGARGLGITIQDNFIWIDNGVRAYKFNKAGGASTGFSFPTGQPGITYDPERHVLWSSGWNDNRYRAFDPATGNIVFTSAAMGLTQGHDLSIGAGKIWVASENGSPDKIYSIEINGGAIDQIVECSGTYTDPGYTVTDNCVPAPPVTVTGSVNTSAPGTYTLTYTATDAGGNTTTATRTVTVLDRQIPVPVVANLPVINQQCSATVTAPTANDACAGTITATTTSPLTYTAQGTYSIVWTYNDGSGNITTQTQTVIVDDVTPPVPNVTTLPTIKAECAASVSAPTATDNCKGLVTGVTTDATTFNTQGTFTINWMYDDGNGNITTQVQTVIVKDVTPPVISCPFNITVNAETGKCGAVVNYSQPSATDNCGTGTLPTSLPGHTYMGTFGGHTYFLSNTVTDPETAHANAILAGGHLVTIGSEAENAFVSAMNPGFIWIGHTDRASEGTWKWVTSEPVTFTKWNAGEPNNAGGNEDWAVINWGPNGTWNDWYYTSTARYVIEFEGGNIPTTLVSGLGSGSIFPVGTTTETWQAVDAGGNIVTCSFTVTVVDNQNPTITAPAAITVNTDPGVCATSKANVNLGTPVVGDNCPGVSYSNNAPAVFSKGTTIVTWTAKDAANRTATSTQIVTVVDNEMPQLLGIPANVTVQCTSVPAPAVVNATDNCTRGPVTMTEIKTNGNCAGNYILTRTWSVTDGSGNTTTGTQVITVVDLTAPELTIPANTAAQCDAIPAVGTATAVDNCGTATVTYLGEIRIDGSCENWYQLKRTWRAEDNCGNFVIKSQFISVGDNTPPTFTRPADVTLYKDAECTVDASPSGAAGDVTNESDNCSAGLNATYSDVVVNNCEGTYTITRTWSLADRCGNSAADQVQTIIVTDNTAPTFTRLADVVLYKDAACIVDSSPAGAAGDVTDESDNCSTGLNATYSDVVENNCEGTYTITRTWSLVDNCGNAAASQVQIITVRDNTAPTFTRPADITIYTDANCSYDASLAMTGDVTNESDNCSSGIQATYSDVITAGSCQGTHVITRTWNLVDNCGNAAAAQVQTITVSDNTAPVITYNAGSIFHCFDTTANNYSVPALTASDNCSSTLTYAYGVYAQNGDKIRSGFTSNASGAFSVGVNSIKWTVTDDCGNTTLATTLVTINPPITGSINSFNVLPQGTNANTLYLGYTPASSATIKITAGGGTAPYTYSWSSSAPAGSFTVVAGDPSSITVKALAAGVYTYTATVTDAKGCVARFVKTITVLDVRCGNKMDKVLVCHKTGSASNTWVQICIAPAAVATHLANGSYLGACVTPAITKTVRPTETVAPQVVVVYPNPNRGQFVLQLKDFSAGKVQIQIMDSRGRTVASRSETVSYSIQDFSFNLQVAAGSYHVRVLSQNGATTATIVIAR